MKYYIIGGKCGGFIKGFSIKPIQATEARRFYNLDSALDFSRIGETVYGVGGDELVKLWPLEFPNKESE